MWMVILGFAKGHLWTNSPAEADLPRPVLSGRTKSTMPNGYAKRRGRRMETTDRISGWVSRTDRCRAKGTFALLSPVATAREAVSFSSLRSPVQPPGPAAHLLDDPRVAATTTPGPTDSQWMRLKEQKKGVFPIPNLCMLLWFVEVPNRRPLSSRRENPGINLRVAWLLLVPRLQRPLSRREKPGLRGT